MRQKQEQHGRTQKHREIDSEQQHSGNHLSEKDIDSDYNEGVDIDILDSSLKQAHEKTKK